MTTPDAIRSQYHASLTMLAEAVSKCPDPLWDDREHPNRFWQIAYHALFYTHLYLQERVEAFVPWSKHRRGYERLGSLPVPPHPDAASVEPYAKQDLLAYLSICRDEVDERVPALNLEAESGFHWLPFDKLELQFYNIRHLQHHVGQLADRLRSEAAIGLGWVGRGA
ncbi:MAG: DinB family protein [Anaerolineae bacterium]|nr:DinB family protein [Anaerolineae bacterium]